MAKLDENGHEILDDKPVAMPIGFKRPPTIQEQIRAFVRSPEFVQMVRGRELETFEEADDFNVGDDYDPRSPHELHFDPELGREVTQDEKRFVDEGRQAFDSYVTEQRKKKKKFVEEKPTEQKEPATLEDV